MAETPHAFITIGADNIVRVKISTGEAGSFPPTASIERAVSWVKIFRNPTIEIRDDRDNKPKFIPF